MARAGVFCDSFDTYNDLNLKYAGNTNGVIDLTGTKSRTGIGCCILLGAFGPVLSVPPIRGLSTAYMCGAAFYQNGNEDGVSAGIFDFIDVDPGGGGDITHLFRCGINAALGMTCTDAFNNTIGISAPNLAVPNSYNYVEMKVFFDRFQGIAIVRLNGATVFHLTNIATLDPSRSADGGECNNIRLGGPGGAAGARFDDFYCYTSTSQADDEFLGAVNIYGLTPSANGGNIEWTPLAGSNFSEVNEVPPDGDTSYVSSGAVGDVDEYIYPVVAQVPAGRQVIGVQHSLCSRVPAATAGVASSVNGVASAGQAVGSIYHYVPIVFYDQNPHTGAPWLLTDFPATQLGPKQTA